MTVPSAPWSLAYWQQLEASTCQQALQMHSDTAAWQIIARQARQVLRSYSTSFFVVTRFLPPEKRAQVEAIYAAVRYPDEIVDTFNMSAADKAKQLAEWEAQYEIALSHNSVQERLSGGVPCFIASFAEVVQQAKIPPEYYRAFMAAMNLDVAPRRFKTLDDLIDSYIYGSAVVVGYFLAYVYGPATGDMHGADFARAMQASKDLGIALQLTNFLRDVAEDQKRGRLYLPLDLLQAEGIYNPDATDPLQQKAFDRVLKKLTRIAEDYYASALRDLHAFAPNCRTAIQACISVYRELNQQIQTSPRGILHRESVPMRRKFQVLPPSKYWRLPLAYLTH